MKKTIQHRNNLLTYYPKEHTLCEQTQLYCFTGIKVVQDKSDANNQLQHDVKFSTQLSDSKIKETKNNILKTSNTIYKQKTLKTNNKSKIRKKKSFLKKQKKNHHNENHHDYEINHEKIIEL